MTEENPIASDLLISAAISNLEFMRIQNREALSGEVIAGGVRRVAVNEALKKYMTLWSDAEWVDNSVSLVGFWLVSDTPEDFWASFRDEAASKTASGNEGEKRAWKELYDGISEALEDH